MTDAPPKSLAARKADAKIKFRKYQEQIFLDRTLGMLILHWSRQIGKSYTLASWAVDRLLTQLQSYDSWLVTVLSNSKDNGAEFVIKCQEVCNKMGLVMESDDQSPDITYDNMRMEVRIHIGKKIGRIKVLAANPRTARGFSGDLILDEFGFHENSPAIWDAAEPILSSNAEFLCRIASTGNGKYNMFYRMASGPGPNNGEFFTGVNGFTVSRVTRTEACKMGVKVFDRITRAAITPDEAMRRSLDKRSYLQNYECEFNDENTALLTHELISAAQRDGVTIDDQAWSTESILRVKEAKGRCHGGFDVGRVRDLSVICIIEKIGTLRRVIAMLRMAAMRFPDQQEQLDRMMATRRVERIDIDMTGLGVGLVDYAQQKWGTYGICGVNFSSTEPISDLMRIDGKTGEKARVTEIMATDLMAVFEDRAIEIPNDPDLVEDLRKPEKITSPGGRVSIAAVRDEAGHADHFWSLALAVRAGIASGGPVTCGRLKDLRPTAGNLGMGRVHREVFL